MISTVHIDLKGLSRNLDAVNKRLKPGVMKMAVVKDNAYGHGMIPVSRFLSDKVEWFCVARIEEGIAIRNSGISNPILVLEMPHQSTASEYLKYNLTASISDLSTFGVLPDGTDAHLHFDTGMFRLGILPDDINAAKQKINDTKISVTGIYTHFANSDVDNHERVKVQLDLFNTLRDQFPDEWMTHTANSGAIFYYEELDLQFDAVRPGVCLYGYAPGPDQIDDLNPILRWESELIQVKKVSKGDKVGYGSRWEAQEEGWLGVIPVGYAQGIFRGLSNKINVLIEDKIYPQVGTISMDYIMVYLGIDKLATGVKTILLSDGELSAMSWADDLGTIPYEITSAISDKIERVYHK